MDLQKHDNGWKRTKKKVIHAEAKEIVSRVIDICDEEARTGELRIDLPRRQKRASDYTGISISSIKKIVGECRKAGSSKLPARGKHRVAKMSRIVQLDYFGIHVVRNVINDFYLFHKGELNSSKLREAIKEKIDFPGAKHVLTNLLRDMGFKWKKCRKSRYQLLLENPYLIAWRFKYLQSIRKAREQNKEVIYVSETWIDSNFTFKKCWYNGDSTCIQLSINRSKKLIILYACRESGFIENTQLIFRANETTESYDGHMNYQTYEKWLSEKLLPNIPGNCVIVLDSSPYNCAEMNKVPSKYATKATMITWLEKNGISVSRDMHKGEVYNLVAKCKANEKVYCIDRILKTGGHTVLRLPPYMFDLNPLELVWGKVESKLRHKNLTTDHPPDLKMTTIEAINSITAEDWVRFYSDVIKIENEYLRVDEAMDIEMDKFLVNLLHPDSSESTSESESEVG